MTDKPDLEHLNWAIEERAEIQLTALALYECITKHPAFFSSLEVQVLLNHLVGAAFSLWRAVFLADTIRHFDDIQTSQLDFLAKLITDNTITFSDDKAHKNWTVGYYLENAKLRLSAAVEYSDKNLKTKLAPEMTPYLDKLGFMGKDLTRKKWESAHFVLRHLLKSIHADTTVEPRAPNPIMRGRAEKYT